MPECITNGLASHPVFTLTVTANVVIRRQLEEQLERQQASDKQTHDELIIEAKRQHEAQWQAEEKANSARRRLAEEVQSFQQLQISSHAHARCCHKHAYSQETLTCTNDRHTAA